MKIPTYLFEQMKDFFEYSKFSTINDNKENVNNIFSRINNAVNITYL